MKTFAVKRQDGSIYLIKCKSSPESFMEDSDNDTLLNEITEANPLPDKKYRDSWTDSSGDITVAQADIDAKDRGDKLDAIREHREPLLEEADKELHKHSDGDANAVGLEADWKAYRKNLRDITDQYKDVNGDPTSAIDGVDDPATDVTWPTKPS